MGSVEQRQQPGAGEPAASGTDEASPRIGDFLERPTRRLADWHWLWGTDTPFPTRSHRGAWGRFLVLLKRLLRPLVTVPQNDLWERQRVFNVIVLENLERLDDLEARLRHVEDFLRDGLDEVMRHNDSLFFLVDQKLDRYRRESREQSSYLRSALAVAAEHRPAALERADGEAAYVGLENRHRGTREEIAARIERHLPRLRGLKRVLDLGCGRGEALEVLARAGHHASGVDASAEMVRLCRERGLVADCGDLFEALAGCAAESLDAVVSFHVVEHLEPSAVDRLVRLAWRALRPGGVLLLETPSPLSLVAGARNFWLDPTHRRPVHPDALGLAFESAGFEGVERLDLNPFAAADRLPEIDLAGLSEPERQLADRVNRLRDRLDSLLFGWQDFAVIGRRPAAARVSER